MYREDRKRESRIVAVRLKQATMQFHPVLDIILEFDLLAYLGTEAENPEPYVEDIVGTSYLETVKNFTPGERFMNAVKEFIASAEEEMEKRLFWPDKELYGSGERE